MMNKKDHGMPRCKDAQQEVIPNRINGTKTQRACSLCVFVPFCWGRSVGRLALLQQEEVVLQVGVAVGGELHGIGSVLLVQPVAVIKGVGHAVAVSVPGQGAFPEFADTSRRQLTLRAENRPFPAQRL